MYEFIKAVGSFLGDDSGTTMVEYALILALIGLAGMATAGGLATAISGQLTTASGSI